MATGKPLTRKCWNRKENQWFERKENRGFDMGPAYFVIAILGCADGGSACTQVATLQTRYSTSEQCVAATASALETNNDFDFPTLLARCRSGNAPLSADAQPEPAPRADARRG
jgi:hypothetical protein